MRQVFIRFYLTVVLCFLVSSLLIGSVYKHLIERTNQRYLSDIFKSTVSIIEEDLGGLPQSLWHDEASRLRGKLPVPVQIESLKTYDLSPETQASLENGNIILLENRGLYLHRIHQTGQIVVLGPIPFIERMGKISWPDVLALALMCAALGIPTILWLRPFWRDLWHIIRQSRRFGNGDYTVRVKLESNSPLGAMGNTFNRMAEDIEATSQSRRALIDAVSHDLRTPLARLRYRLEAIKAGAEQGAQITGIERDLGQIDQLLDEWLTMSSLARPEMQMDMQLVPMLPWLNRLAEESAQGGLVPLVRNETGLESPQLAIDLYYFGRAVGNLLSNARRYGGEQIEIILAYEAGHAMLMIDDNGKGIPPDQRSRLLQPFTRMEESRNRSTGGFGLGLAIVAMILRGHGGGVEIEDSPLGGARIVLNWPSEIS